MDAPPVYPSSWGLPDTRDARICAVRMVERQAAFMTDRGWPVTMPVVRVTETPESYFFVPALNEYVAGVTFDASSEHDWHVILPAGTERALCRTEARLRARRLPDRREALITVFHELSHQFYRDEIQTEWRAQRLNQHFTTLAKRHEVRLGRALRWSAS